MKFQQQQQQQQHHVTIEKTTSPRVEKGIELFFDLKFSFVLWVSFRCICEKIPFSIKDTRSTPKNPAHAHKKKELLK